LTWIVRVQPLFFFFFYWWQYWSLNSGPYAC
jgi:hypothetical protein